MKATPLSPWGWLQRLLRVAVGRVGWQGPPLLGGLFAAVFVAWPPGARWLQRTVAKRGEDLCESGSRSLGLRK